jgi:ABC-type Fe3+-hydroxamate transport system substrate-binding protein
VRIISLVPSITETLSSWDRAPVACTRFCERNDLEHVGGTKDPNIDAIVGLKPDLVVVDVEENRQEDYEALLERGITVHVLHVRSLFDVNPMMDALAERVDATWSEVELGDPELERARAFVPIWRRPWIALGAPTYGASILSHLGVGNVYDGASTYPKIDFDDAIIRHPDFVIAPSEPYPFTARQLRELERVAPTTFIDGKDLFWWGSRTRDAITRLGAVLREL